MRIAAPPFFPLLLFALAFFAALSAFNPMAPHYSGHVQKNDDFMRMVKVFDLIDGTTIQGESDTVPRLGLEGGADVPWSRLIDAPLAAIQITFEQFLHRHDAVIATVTLYSFILWTGFVFLAYWFANGLISNKKQSLHVIGMILLCFITVRQFWPGRIDHHMVQILILMAGFGFLIRLWTFPDRRTTTSALAGALFGLGLAIGTDILPWVVLGSAFIGIFWVLDRRQWAVSGTIFGFSMTALAGIIHTLLHNQGDFLRLHCDALGLPFLAMATCVALFWTGASLLPSNLSNTSIKRILCGIAIGIPLAAGLYWFTPHCFHDPYQISDPWVRFVWLDHVSEAKSILNTQFDVHVIIFGFLAAIYAGLAGCVLGIQNDRNNRLLWINLLIIGLLACTLLFLQIRTAQLLQAFMIAPGTYAVFIALKSLKSRLKFFMKLPPLARIGIEFVFLIGMIWMCYAMLTQYREKTLNPGQEQIIRESMACNLKPMVPALQAIDHRQTFVTTVDHGAPLIYWTHHRALAAPYHRNQGGLAAAYRILLSETVSDAARQIEQSGTTAIMICKAEIPSIRSRYGFKNIFAEQLMDNNHPDWITEEPLPDSLPFRIFMIDREAIEKSSDLPPDN